MVNAEEILRGLWVFPIVLPNSPLKWLNCYVIKGNPGERNLLIDTGFNLPECREALLCGMLQLGLQPENTDVFLTHFHSDHTGNAPLLESLGCRLFMSREDGELFSSRKQENFSVIERIGQEGIHTKKILKIFRRDPAIVHIGEFFHPTLLEERDVLSYGRFHFTCISTPGHTPGHMCLYDAENKVLILGDHVLFDISPNISAWTDDRNMLGLYMDSLRKVMDYDVVYALPAHRNLPEISLKERCLQLFDHHEERLAEIFRVIESHAGYTAYQTARKISWHVHAGSWSAFSPSQRYFAITETLAHLDCLCSRNMVCRKKKRFYYRYYPVAAAKNLQQRDFLP